MSARRCGVGGGGGNAYTGKGGVTRKGNRAKAEKRGIEIARTGWWEGGKGIKRNREIA